MHGLYFINKGTINVFEQKRSNKFINPDTDNICIDDNIYKELCVLCLFIFILGRTKIIEFRNEIWSEIIRFTWPRKYFRILSDEK